MNTFALAAAFFFAAPSHAVVMDNPLEIPSMVCESSVSEARIYSAANEKQSLIVVDEIQHDGERARVFSGSVFNVAAEPGSMFMSSDLNLYVVPAPNGSSMKGFLRLNPDQPGVPHAMDCQVIMTIQPIDASAY